jgi:hypothetical protein
MKIRSIALAGVIAVAGIAVPTSIVEAKPAGVTVKGTAPGASKVFLLTGSGRSYRATAEASGAFTITGVPAAAVANATLQFTDATSKYLGTAVFRVVKSGKFWKAIVGLKAMKRGTLNVGALSYKDGWYKAARPVGAGTAGVRAVDRSGKPQGAGRAGRVKLVKASVATMSTLQKLAATTCPDGSPKDPKLNGNNPGQDLDCDSVPNTIDVDDNGNGSLDILDQSTNDRDDKNNYTASIATYSDMRASMESKLNINAPGASLDQLTTNIASLLSGKDATGGGFSLAVFLGDWSLISAAGAAPDAVYIECPGIKWCDAAAGTGTALINGNSEMNEIPGASAYWQTPKDWKSFASTEFSTTAIKASESYKTNGLYKFTQNNQVRWAAFLTPNYKEKDVAQVIRANDVMILHSVAGSNDVAIPVTVSPFFVTTPYLKSATADGVKVDTANANFGKGHMKIGADGKLGIEFWRPQRMVLEGETGPAGFEAFKSQHGLNYGINVSSARINGQQIQPNVEVGCAGAEVDSYYKSTTLKTSTKSYGDPAEDPASDFWALKDETADSDPDNVLDLEINLKDCLTNHKPAHFSKQRPDLVGKTVGEVLNLKWSDFVSNSENWIELTLTGVGSPSTNGYNRSVLNFRIYPSNWNGTIAGSTSNSGNNNSGGNTGSSNTGSNNTGSSNTGSNNSGNSGSNANPTVVRITPTNSTASFTVTGMSTASCNKTYAATDGWCSGPATSITVFTSATSVAVDTGSSPSIKCTASNGGKLLTCTVPSGEPELLLNVKATT